MDLISKTKHPASCDCESCRIKSLDIHLTPDNLALAICDYLKKQVYESPISILEPSAGEGAFVRAVFKTWPLANIQAVECRLECSDILKKINNTYVFTSQLLDIPKNIIQKYDCVIGNPPFNQANEHISFLLDQMSNRSYLSFLLRINFLGSKRRLEFWKKYPEYGLAPIVPRPGFSSNGKTDMTEYGLFIWKKGYIGPSLRLPHLVWTKDNIN